MAGAVGIYANTVEVIAVQGTTVEVATSSVTVVISMGSLDHIVVTPATATIAQSGTQQFTAQGYDSNNVAIPGLTYTWSLGTGATGTISTSGLYAAGTTTGTFTIQANVQGSTTPTGSATVTVSTTPPVTTTASGSQGRCSINRPVQTLFQERKAWVIFWADNGRLRIVAGASTLTN